MSGNRQPRRDPAGPSFSDFLFGAAAVGGALAVAGGLVYGLSRLSTDENDRCVVNFDQRLGAVHSKCWSRYAFSTFL